MKGKKLSQEELVEYLKSGGSQRLQALAQLYEHPELRERIVNHVKFNGGQAEDGHDTFVEAVVIAERSIRQDKFKKESKLTTYVFGIAKFYWANQRRKRKVAEVSLDHLPEDISDLAQPELIFIENDLKDKLEQVFSLLNEKCRNILRLWSNYKKYAEISEELGIPNTSQLRKLKYDCQTKLKEYLLKRPELIPDYYARR